MKKSFTVQDLPAAERPRERLMAYGAEALSAQELIALVLGRGIRGESVMMTAQRLLSAFGSLEAIMDASLEDLCKINGIGTAKACQIKACLEIARRNQNQKEDFALKNSSAPKICSPKQICILARQKLINYQKEHFLIFSFDAHSKLIGADIVSVGTLNASLVHPRETFEAAIKRHAHHIIMAHNHPSEKLEPSAGDKEITVRLVKAGEVLGIELIDHVIIGQKEYFSFKENNLI